ncbi:hypothetical protein AHAS_Ahas19G0289700 [Arachis hypogaea]
MAVRVRSTLKVILDRGCGGNKGYAGFRGTVLGSFGCATRGCQGTTRTVRVVPANRTVQSPFSLSHRPISFSLTPHPGKAHRHPISVAYSTNSSI